MQYIGKDIVTRGASIRLDPDSAWRLLRSRAKQGIRKADGSPVEVRLSRNLEDLAKVWYDPTTLPETLTTEQTLFVADYVRADGDREVIGAVLVTPSSPNTLFYHYGGSSQLGKAIEINAFLLWRVVLHFSESSFEFLDVGVSFREELQHYFQKYCTDSYPIIFNPPDPLVGPSIRISPADSAALDPTRNVLGAEVSPCDLRSLLNGRPHTWVPSGRYAIKAALVDLKLGPSDVVTICPSLQTDYVSGCVTRAIETRCRWSMRIEPETKAILVIHEWGVIHPKLEQIASLGFPIIEDCAYSTLSADSDAGRIGRYAVYSLPKMLPALYGGLLVGKEYGDRELWDRVGCLDANKMRYGKRIVASYCANLGWMAARRRENWRYLERLFRRAGFSPYFVPSSRDEPAVFMLNCGQFGPAFLRDRFRAFGVECGIYHGNGAVFVPCHYRLTETELDYVFAVFRGLLNPCYTFRRTERVEGSGDE